MLTIDTPLPGVFYRRPNPNAEPFVQEGDSVKAGDTVGVIEVMKQYFPLTAQTDGVLGAFLVEDGGEVEAGQAVAQLK